MQCRKDQSLITGVRFCLCGDGHTNIGTESESVYNGFVLWWDQILVIFIFLVGYHQSLILDTPHCLTCPSIDIYCECFIFINYFWPVCNALSCLCVESFLGKQPDGSNVESSILTMVGTKKLMPWCPEVAHWPVRYALSCLGMESFLRQKPDGGKCRIFYLAPWWTKKIVGASVLRGSPRQVFINSPQHSLLSCIFPQAKTTNY